MAPQTLFDRIWTSHVVVEPADEPALLYVDLHLIHEVTSPQAFEGLRLAGRRVRRPDLSVATMDHNVPTEDGPITDPLARRQLDALRHNCEEFGVPLYATGSGREGIVHVIGPELGISQPGMTIVCGDSHTSTHGAFGALAFGIGTSEVEHVLATQTLPQRKPKTMRVNFDGELTAGVSKLAPQVTWGTNPEMVVPVHGEVPDPADYDDPAERGAVERALTYMGLEPRTKIEDITIDRVFIGSCTNARIEDLRTAAAVVSGKHVHPSVRALVVPGSAGVKQQAEEEGLDRIFTAAGFEWRRAGCSMCLGMNPDILQPGERCAST